MMWPEPWASINRVRRQRKVKQFPDLPHPYRPATVTARQFRGAGGGPDPSGGRAVLAADRGRPCIVCRCSRSHKNHME